MDAGDLKPRMWNCQRMGVGARCFLRLVVSRSAYDADPRPCRQQTPLGTTRRGPQERYRESDRLTAQTAFGERAKRSTWRCWRRRRVRGPTRHVGRIGSGTCRRLLGHRPIQFRAPSLSGNRSRQALVDPSPVDHAFEQDAHGDSLPGGFGFDPGSPVVIETDTDNGGLGGRYGC